MTDNNVTNILMAGVGGQGTLLASEILSEVLMQAGYDVKKAEVHGMAQRGGSVVSQWMSSSALNCLRPTVISLW
jgi:indolepyruvate ferredoxin oxidoreductase beta subunit